ncbi:uncharacterized protein LOC135696551 [Rhopilema esculentum]|uniref:uncharacterized protein LOC135696551 n=1 Tax=Rhopilema esculentum TaxID=499914 RepID=UPI0031D2EE06
MTTWNVLGNILLTAALTLSVYVSGIPMQGNKRMLFQNGMNKEEIVARLNEKLSMVDTEARISRIFYNKNATFEQDTFIDMPKQLFKMFLNTAGIGKMADVLSMSWIEITSLKGPFSNEKEQASQCNELLHPDHLLSNVILENLIPLQDKVADSKTKGSVIESLRLLFCSKSMKTVTLQYMQTDDVISGLVILGLDGDGSLLFFANVGF